MTSKYDYTVAVTAEIKSFELCRMTKMVTETHQYLKVLSFQASNTRTGCICMYA